jgi:hypothetical protein
METLIGYLRIYHLALPGQIIRKRERERERKGKGDMKP